jgi:hypothetical protein
MPAVILEVVVWAVMDTAQASMPRIVRKYREDREGKTTVDRLSMVHLF